jgi:hypothetical protein
MKLDDRSGPIYVGKAGVQFENWAVISLDVDH